MQWQAVFHLGARMARRNHLYLFAWLCAVGLPGLLQVIAGQVQDVRDYLGEYYGVATLYMFFAMTFGFGTIFVSYYQANGYRRAGTLDLLRTSGLAPGAVLGGVFLQLQQVLVPPLVAALLGLFIYLRVSPPARGWLSGFSLADGLAFGLVLLLIQAVLGTVPLLGLFRRSEGLTLLSLLLVLPLNIMPLILQRWLRVSAGYIVLGLLGTLALALLAALWNLSRLWPPERLPQAGGR
jgi:hypothetical protein